MDFLFFKNSKLMSLFMVHVIISHLWLRQVCFRAPSEVCYRAPSTKALAAAAVQASCAVRTSREHEEEVHEDVHED